MPPGRMLRMAARPSSSGLPVHAFKPTSGSIIGVVGLVVAAMVIVLVVVDERSLVGLRAALVAALAGVVVWMTLLRPRVTAYSDTLLLRNMAGDVHVPMAAIDDVTVRHALVVRVGERRYSCPGIGRSTRSMIRSSGGGPTGLSGPAATSGNQDYVGFVETTIEDLARAARRDARLVSPDSVPPPVRRSWAVPELAAVALLVVALVVTLLL
jgi:hypothetical protein